jgi:hypothetical protein
MTGESMEITDVIGWILIIIGITWTVFAIIVMVALLRFTSEAIPYLKRANLAHRRGEVAKEKAAAPWAYE